MSKITVVKLTKEQEIALKGVMDEARAAAQDGTPGIVAAQVFGGHMRVGFLSADRAGPIVTMLDDGTTQRVRTVYDC